MKIKGLLLGLFACAGLVACTDNDIAENASDVTNKSEKADAYLTFSIATSGNSSRATTTGDGHGNQEDSGHGNVGTADESNVKSIMIVFYNTTDEVGGDGLAANYDLTSSTSGIKKNTDETYSPLVPYQLSTDGLYKVLVIINPNAKISALAQSGIIPASSAKTVYETILNGESSAMSDIIGAGQDAFMMINKGDVSIQVSREMHDSPATAATGDIEVERVASKITFRPTTLADFTAKNDLTDGANVYRVDASHTTYTVTTSDGWVKNEDGNNYIYYNKFNLATTNEREVSQRTVIYVLLNGNETTFYTKGADHTGYVDGVATTAPIMTRFEMGDKKPIYQGTAGAPVDVPYYVRLERYALVNLNNAVYNVRHTTATPADAASAKVFGTVGSSNYLFEPNTAEKSAVDLANWEPTTSGTAWFGETAIFKTEEAIKTNKVAEIFQPLPKTSSQGPESTVTGGNPEDTNVGSLLAYCMENAVLASNQDRVLTTGVFFEAQIYDKDGNAVSRMYKFKDSFYKDLKSLNDATKNMFETFLDENNTNGELDDELATRGVEVFKDGKCYYFSSEIKHFDDANADTKGVMEYAIMRNNIYSLKVDNVDGFGFASTEIVPGETSTGSEDESVYLTMNAKILPWIVRFNNIEF